MADAMPLMRPSTMRAAAAAPLQHAAALRSSSTHATQQLRRGAVPTSEQVLAAQAAQREVLVQRREARQRLRQRVASGLRLQDGHVALSAGPAGSPREQWAGGVQVVCRTQRSEAARRLHAWLGLGRAACGGSSRRKPAEPQAEKIMAAGTRQTALRMSSQLCKAKCLAGRAGRGCARVAWRGGGRAHLSISSRGVASSCWLTSNSRPLSTACTGMLQARASTQRHVQ